MGRRNKEGEFKSLVVRFHEDVKVYRKIGALLKISRSAAAVIKGYRGSLSTTNQSLNGLLSKNHSKDSTALVQSSSEDQGNCFIFGKGILSLLEIRVSVKAYAIRRPLHKTHLYEITILTFWQKTMRSDFDKYP